MGRRAVYCAWPSLQLRLHPMVAFVGPNTAEAVAFVHLKQSLENP